ARLRARPRPQRTRRACTDPGGGDREAAQRRAAARPARLRLPPRLRRAGPDRRGLRRGRPVDRRTRGHGPRRRHGAAHRPSGRPQRVQAAPGTTRSPRLAEGVRQGPSAADHQRLAGMSSTTSTIGLVEWARRARGSAGVHRAVADALGRCVHDAPIGARYALLDRARRHGWCADEWATVVPVLHDVVAVVGPLDAAVDQALAGVGRDPDGTRTLEAETEVAVQLGKLYAVWHGGASPVADGPYLAV